MKANLGPIGRIPEGEGRAFKVGAVEVAVFRCRNGAVFATQASCPHRQGPLADGLLGGCTLVCPLHGFRFDVQTGKPQSPECGALKTYPAWVSPDGEVWLSVEG